MWKRKNKTNRKLDKSKTIFITSCIFVHLRYTRNWWCIATEVDNGYKNVADILAIHKGSVYEFEIKVSCGDIYHERKKYKHKAKISSTHYYSIVIPHIKSLYLCAVKLVEELNPKYGFITVSKYGVVRVKRNSQRLHNSEYNYMSVLEKNIFQRSTSEVASRRKVCLKLEQE